MLQAEKPAWLPLGALLVREGLITAAQLEEALIDQEGTGRRLGELLVEWGWVTSAAISRALAEQYELDYLDLGSVELDAEAVARLPEAVARRYQALPVMFLPDRRLLVGVADPTDVGACDELRTLLGSAIRLAVVDQADLAQAFASAYAS